MAERIDVMISSTARDLPDHRKQVIDAILRMGMHPVAMEHLPPAPNDAIDESLRMVDEAEIYLGIFAHRYGTMPDTPKNPHKLSITEMEYRRAVERNIPRLIFLMGDNHPITAAMLETDAEGSAKLIRLKEELKANYVVGFFKDPDQLREQVIQALSALRKPTAPGANLHFVRDIPTPPEAYIAHPYVLLQTSQVVGRAAELNLLTDWVAKPSAPVYNARILNVVAIGGMGKSALTWKWFNDTAPHEMKPLAGRLWWSFYESDAHFENFIIRALAYVSKRSREDITQNTKPGEREELLLNILNNEPYLFVLDGLERILIAYARMDAAHLQDDEYDQRTANVVRDAYGLPQGAEQSYTGEIRLRKTADPRAGNFLRRLAMVRASRILISTRLFPAELQTVTYEPIPGVAANFLKGLEDDDALNLWRAMGVSGSRDALLPIFRRFDNYPLLIRALAGEVARDRRAMGDFDKWRAANPDFDPFQRLAPIQVKSHVLQFALHGLGDAERQVLETIAAFRAPADYETLCGLFVEGKQVRVDDDEDFDFSFDDDEFYFDELILDGDDNGEPVGARHASPLHGMSDAEIAPTDGEPTTLADTAPPPSTGEAGRGSALFKTETALDACLTTLEDRGLLGWDRRANRYDLHPIVRGVVWARADAVTKQSVYSALHGHFEAVPKIDNWRQVETLEDLTAAIELYNALVGLGRLDDAQTVFRERLDAASFYRLAAMRQQIEWLEKLFPDGVDNLPKLSSPATQARTLNDLALAYKNSGQPGRAVPLYRLGVELAEKQGNQNNVAVGLSNLSDAARTSGGLHTAEWAARRALEITREQGDRFREAISLQYIGLALGARETPPPDPLFKGRFLLTPPLNPLPVDGEGTLRPRMTFTAPQRSVGGEENKIPTLENPDPLPISQAVADAYGEGEQDQTRDDGESAGARHASPLHGTSDAETERENGDSYSPADSTPPPSTGEAGRGSALPDPAILALRRSMHIFEKINDYAGIATAFLAQVQLWRGEGAAAKPFADRAWELAHVRRNERDFISAARLQGEAAVYLGDFDHAGERLHHALTRARAVNLAQEELPALVALAEMARRQGDLAAAREHLADVWDGAERGPYPLFAADAYNVLAQVERDAMERLSPPPDPLPISQAVADAYGEGEQSGVPAGEQPSNGESKVLLPEGEGFRMRAIAAATRAYTLAWCDGISADGQHCYAYWWGLQKAKAHLEALGAEIPQLTPFDPAEHAPMPEVEINPRDKYYVEEHPM